MDTLKIKGDWNITRGKLKQKSAKLTDDDLQFAEGKLKELFGRIQKVTGETREVVEKAVNKEGLFRICAWCRKVSYKDKWMPLEEYIQQKYSINTSHCICPDCAKKIMPSKIDEVGV